MFPPSSGIRREGRVVDFSSTSQIGAALAHKKQKAQAEYALIVTKSEYQGFLASRERDAVLPGSYPFLQPGEPVNFCLFKPLVLKDPATNKALIRYWGNFTEICDIEDSIAVGLAIDLFVDIHKKDPNYKEHSLVIEMSDLYIKLLTEKALDLIYRKLLQYRGLIEFVFPSFRHLKEVLGDKVNEYGESVAEVIDTKIDHLFKLWAAETGQKNN